MTLSEKKKRYYPIILMCIIVDQWLTPSPLPPSISQPFASKYSFHFTEFTEFQPFLTSCRSFCDCFWDVNRRKFLKMNKQLIFSSIRKQWGENCTIGWPAIFESKFISIFDLFSLSEESRFCACFGHPTPTGFCLGL